MSKKRAKIRFVWLTIVVLIGLFLAVCPFSIPFSTDTYNGFAKSIVLENLGLDFSGGEAVVYDCDTKDVDTTDVAKYIDQTCAKIRNILVGLGLNETTVLRQDDNKIKVEVSSASDQIFDWIASPKKLFVTAYKCSDQNPDVKALFSSDDILNVTPTYQLKDGSTSEVEYGVLITYNADAANRVFKAPDDELYVYVDEITTAEPFGTIDRAKLISNTSAFIKSDTLASDQNAAVENAYNFLSGTFKIKLSNPTKFKFSAPLGENTLLYCTIAGGAILLAIMIFLWVKYGDLGLLADFALVVFAILMLFFLQAIPFILITLPALAGILLSIILVADSHVIIFNKIKEEYARGKKIHLAVKGGFKRAFWPILDSHIVVSVISLIVYFIGDIYIKTFAFPLFVGTILSFFITQVITRFFVNSYLPLNSTNAKKLRLYREKGVVEIKEEEDVKQDKGINILANPQAPENLGGDNK